MASRGKLVLEGRSGRYEFEVYDWGTKFNSVAAVYYVSNRKEKPDGGGKHSAIYIGQTEDMSDRFDNHHDAECFKKHGANAISVHRDSNERSREKKEADLIAGLNPPCNG